MLNSLLRLKQHHNNKIIDQKSSDNPCTDNFGQINQKIEGCQYENNTKSFITFLHTLSKRPYIVTQFSLDVRYCNLVDIDVMRTLVSTLQVFSQLTHLSLMFDTKTLDLQNATDSEQQSLKNEFMKLSQLESLSICIKNSQTDDDQIIFFSQIFSSFRYLKHFKIELEDSHITNSGFKSLCQLIHSLLQLTRLNFSMVGNKKIIEQNQYLCLWDSINQLKQLQELTVSISDYNLLKNQQQSFQQHFCQNIESLTSLSFRLINNSNNNFSLLFKQLQSYLRYLPNLESLCIDCGDDLPIDFSFLEQIAQTAIKLNNLKLYIGKKSSIENKDQVENILKNLVKESELYLSLNSDNNYIQIQIKNKDNQTILDLNIFKDNRIQEQIILNAVFLILSKSMKRIKTYFKRLFGFEDILKRCDFTNLEELDIETFSDNQNMKTISLFLDSISKSKLQVLNLKTSDIYSPLNYDLIENFKDQLLQLTSLKKINLQLEVQDLQFSLQFIVRLLENLLANSSFDFKIDQINIQYNNTYEHFFLFENLINGFLSKQEEGLCIKFDQISDKLIINSKNTALNVPVTSEAINYFIKSILLNIEGFQRMNNFTIINNTGNERTILSKPHQRVTQQQMNQKMLHLSSNQWNREDNGYFSLLNNLFSEYEYQYREQNSYQDRKQYKQGSNIIQLSHLKKIDLDIIIYSEYRFEKLIRNMDTVQELNIHAYVIDNKVINLLSGIKTLKKLQLYLKKSYSYDQFIQVNNSNLEHNENIRFINLKIDEKDLKKLDKKKVAMIFKRICKRLVVV